MMANNSSGARSVLYGKTIDHVLEQDVVLSDGTVTHFGPLSPEELDAKCAGSGLESECYRTVRRLARELAEEVDRRFPKVLRRVSGYNLDEFTDEKKPFNLAKLMVGSEGTLGVVLEAKVNLFGVNVGMGAFTGAVILAVVGAADHKEALRRMPWSVIMMMSGVTVLIALLEKTEGLDLVASLLARFATPGTITGFISTSVN